jgi:hypothetical protein
MVPRSNAYLVSEGRGRYSNLSPVLLRLHIGPTFHSLTCSLPPETSEMSCCSVPLLSSLKRAMVLK